MTDAQRQEVPAPELRERALARLTPAEGEAQFAGIGEPAAAELQALLHELRVHQVELELQNEELRQRQHELETSRRRWFELYDLAPVAYCTVGETGLILQVNLAAAALLRQARAVLVKRRLSEFIHLADRPRILRTACAGAVRAGAAVLRAAPAGHPHRGTLGAAHRHRRHARYAG